MPTRPAHGLFGDTISRTSGRWAGPDLRRTSISFPSSTMLTATLSGPTRTSSPPPRPTNSAPASLAPAYAPHFSPSHRNQSRASDSTSREQAIIAEMWSSDSDRELTVAAVNEDSSSTASSTDATPPPSPPPSSLRTRCRRLNKTNKSTTASPPRDAEAEETDASDAEPEAEDVWRGAQWEAAWPGRHQPKPVVLAEDSDSFGRSRSLTDDDLEELKGCADLGFGFSYDEIPELRDTLPALELCYSMSQKLLDDQPAAEDAAPEAAASPAPVPVTNWKISSPGDSPEEVKARLKYWAQAVACTVRLCT